MKIYIDGYVDNKIIRGFFDVTKIKKKKERMKYIKIYIYINNKVEKWKKNDEDRNIIYLNKQHFK